MNAGFINTDVVAGG